MVININYKKRGIISITQSVMWWGLGRMSTAFVLFKCQPQRELEVYLALLEIDSVTETHVAYGEYDLVARIDFEDETQMANTLIGKMRSIPGVQKTETLIAVEA